MGIVAIMEALAEQGITVLLKVDAERMAERRKPWTFVASGAHCVTTSSCVPMLRRWSSASKPACPRLRELGFTFPE
ncbi:hypothetical protein [Streptomyces sp. SP18CS02]|uniref:hypothetical protein n=1 Tax=Streptomyces sp. SP18CS02 TaxID=3002531 RepID=UPI002E79D43A|nr:hypothetical protein [Streptomyces sp. SP18CS02]MEE1753016.1 hypothetical protein [Streptomyces sp. SP18CS02]